MFELTTPFGTKSFVAELYVNITHLDHFCPLRDFKGNISQIERRVVGCNFLYHDFHFRLVCDLYDFCNFGINCGLRTGREGTETVTNNNILY